MSKSTSRISAIGFALLFIGFALPLLFGWADWPPFRKLSGAFTPASRVELTVDSWMDASFQEAWEPWFNDSLSVRAPLIRTKNQFFYSFFDHSTSYVVPAKNNQLFAYNYFPAYKGFDFKGEDYWAETVQRLAALRDTLQAHGIPLVLVIAPNKVRYMPENFPPHWKTEPGKRTNQSTLLAKAAEQGLHTVDLNTWFVNMKDTLTHTPFPNTGTHWNYYGAAMGAQVMMDSVQRLFDTAITRIVLTKGQVKDSTLASDHDLSEGINVIWDLETEPQYYPKMRIDTEGRVKPNVLMVSDSFFWTMNTLEINKKGFSEASSFWFYNNTNYDSRHGETPVDNLNAWEEVLDRDVVIIMGTESNLHLFPYGFAQRMLGEK